MRQLAPSVPALCLLALLANPSTAAAQSAGCSASPLVEAFGPGSSGSAGPLELRAAFLPALGGPFRVQVTGALPSVHGCVLWSAVEVSEAVPEIGGFWYVGTPFWVEPFEFDGDGVSPALLDLAQAPPALCGESFVLQALADDPAAPLGLVVSNPLRVTFGATPTLAPDLDPAVSPTAALEVLLTGQGLFAGDTIVVDGGASSAEGVVAGDGSFEVTVPLAPDKIHTLFVREVLAGGASSAPAVAIVAQDSSPPKVVIDFPPDGAVINGSTTHVAGRVGDSLSGFLGLEVEVNGVTAAVDVGVGTNGTFDAPDVPLNAVGPTTLIATARDALGNESTATAVVTFTQPTGFTLVVSDGDGQSGAAGEELAQPLAVLASKPDGSPFAGKLVRFEVTRSDGLVSAAPGGVGARSLSLFTGADGVARAWWRLGVDAGCGNQRVSAAAAGLEGSAQFSASALAGAPDRIHVSGGGMQWGAPGAAAAEPLGVWVSDGRNAAAGVPVTFTVRAGSGSLRDDSGAAAQILVATTDATGHAAAALTLGAETGNNVVEATFANNPSGPARFVAFAAPPDPDGTSFTALVLDNSGQPLTGAHAELVLASGASFEVVTGDDGRCAFDDLPGGGLAQFHVDGAPVVAAGGLPIDPGSTRFPALHYAPYLHEGAANALPQPVYLPRLDPVNDVLFDGGEEAVLTVAGLEGFELRVAAGAEVVLPDGSFASPANPVVLSLNQVHLDEIPMPLPDGARPPFAWTLQPGGAHFDPPVAVRYPNSVGLAPGAVGYLLSFDHDTNRFEIVATGTVDEAGAQLVSDDGEGLAVSGWGGACPPYPAPADVEGCGDGTCIDDGVLGPFEVQVNNTALPLGVQLCFSVEHVVDSGGEKLVPCEDVALVTAVPPDPTLTFSSVLEAPNGSQVTGSGPVVSVVGDQAGVYTARFGISADRDCPPTTIVPEGQVTVIDALIGKPGSVAFGYDDLSDPVSPWISLPNDPGIGQGLPLSIDPADAYGLTEIVGFKDAVVTVDVEVVGGVPTFVDLFATGGGTGATFVTWRVATDDALPLCGGFVGSGMSSVSVIVYEPRVLKVAYQVIHEENDDEQLIDPGQGKPETVCVRSLLGTSPVTEPGGDDHVVGDAILSGPNGVCESEVDSTLDVQVIPVGQGEPGAVCVGSGLNGIGDSAPLGDDQPVAPDGLIVTGANGICDTPADADDQLAPPPPTKEALEAYLNDVFRQAVVEIELTELPPIAVGYDVNWDLELSLDSSENALIEAAAGAANDLGQFDKVAFLLPSIGALDADILGFAYIGSKFSYSLSGADGVALTTIAHELGHSLGLQHTASDPLNVMFPSAGLNQTKLRKNQWDVLQGVE